MKLTHLDSFIISTGPMLMAYKFFIPGVSFVDVLMILSLFLHGLKGDWWKVKKLPIVFFIFGFLLIHLMYIGVLGEQETLGYPRLAKYLILISFITVTYRLINVDILTKFLLVAVLINVFAILLQYTLFFLLDIKAHLIFTFLPLVNDQISSETISIVLSSNFRPGGLFMEPAHLSYFMFFSGVFFSNLVLEKKRVILTTMGITLFITFSSFGFLAGLFIFFLILRNLRNKEIIVYALLIGTMLIATFNFSALVESVTTIPQLERLTNPESVAVTARLYGSSGLIDDLNTTQQMIGLGMGNFNMDGFVSAITYLSLSFGVFGIALLTIFVIFYLLFNHDNIFHIAIIIGMSFFTALIFTPFLLIALLPFLIDKKYAKN
jgi:hypothetical protein